MKLGPLLVAAFIIGWCLTECGRAEAADPDFGNCEMWRAFDRYHKVAFVGGYQTAMLNLQAIEAMMRPEQFEEKEFLNKTIYRIWPKGHRVGSVVTELDVYCGKSGNADKPLFMAVLYIVAEKNK